MSRVATAFLYIFICGICVLLTSRIPVSSFRNQEDYNWKKKDLLKFLFPILVFTLFWGLRYDVGTDYLEYKSVFETADIMNISHGEAGYEMGYLLTNKLFQLLGFSYISIFLYTSFVYIFSVYFFCQQETKYYTLFAIFFFMTGPVLFAQNGTRQMLAISFCLIGFVFLGKKKLIPWLLFAVIAYLQHRSIIILVVVMTFLYFIKPIRINKYFLIFLNVLLYLFGRDFQTLFINQMENFAMLLSYENYVEGALDRVNIELVFNTGVGRFLLVIVNSIVFLSQDLFLTGKKDIRYYTYWCFIIGSNLIPLFWGNEVLGRLSISFSSLSWCTYAFTMTSLLRKNVPEYSALIIGIVVWSLISFYIAVTANSNGCGSYQMISFS